jgi:hypothetical protein
VRVFVSHAGRDRAWAEWIAWQLEHAATGVEVELDRWDWRARDDHVGQMNAALDRADAIVVVFSQAYFESVRRANRQWQALVLAANQRPRANR